MTRPPLLRLGLEESIVDSFAGGGGASLGIEWGVGRSPDIAINHNPIAIAMHAANHPNTKHYIENVWDVDPREACGGRRPGLAWFSPDCTFHSKARGGKPFRDRNKARRIRGLAWIVVRWAECVRPRVILLENVEEFEDWGPLGEDGKPCPLRKSFTFLRWKKRLEKLGYVVEHRILSACDYGAPTTRKRLFLVARCDGQPIVWPQPTHGPGRQAYRTAAECIDWSIRCPSIFLTKEQGRAIGVKRPLADNTMRRIARGLQKFVIDSPEPFIVPVLHGAGDLRSHSIREPMRTITGAHRGDRAVVTPYLAKFRFDSAGCAIDRPMPTITAGSYITRPAGAGHALGLVAPYLVPRYGERPGQDPRALAIDEPHPTIVPTGNGASLVAAFMAKHYGGHETPGSQLRMPIDTVTARDHHALVASHVVKMKGTGTGHRADAPLHTIQAGGYHYGEVRAFLTKYHRDGGQLADLAMPMPTVVTNDSLGLVTVHGEPYAIVDIGMRMLKPRELFRAQGFPDSYVIDLEVEREIRGKLVMARLTGEQQTEACGNSVSPYMGAALARAQFTDQIIEVYA